MRLRLISLAVVLGLAVLGVVAWQRSTTRAPASESGANPTTNESPMPAEPAAQDPGVHWDPPGRWVTELPQGMRLASYSIPAPGQGGEPAQCAVYYFGPGQGGGVEANLDRWISEFQSPGKPVRRTREVRGLHVSQVEVTGDYTAHANAPGEPARVSAGWTLLGAIVEGPGGTVFFKLTGPGATVAAAAREFDGLLASLRTK